ncbi:MAG: TIGR02587 family membrane protein [Pyrinomonadaceae bacterium]
MADKSAGKNPNIHTNKHFLVGLARAAAGAMLFAFPMFMTMEMWSLGFSIDRTRLALLMFLAVPLLYGLSYFIGFEDTSTFLGDIVDAFVAFAVGFFTSALMLFLFHLLDFSMSFDEIIGKISVQAIVAAIGAMLAQSQLGGSSKDKETEENKKRRASYAGELFFMTVGVLFLAMNTAPTEEMILISYKMSDAQIIILLLFTIIVMHAFVYRVGFHGQEDRHSSGHSVWLVFLRYTIVGYAIVLIISFYLLWTFGRTDGLNLEDSLKIAVVAGFPGALGAAASRLIL